MAASCDVFDAFRYATENLDSEIHRFAKWRSIWLNLIERGEFPANAGTSGTVFSVGRVEPTTDVGAAWTDVSLGDPTDATADSGIDALCTPDWNSVEWGFNQMNYGLEMYQVKGPKVCKKELEHSHNVDEFISSYVDELTNYVKRIWELNYEYHHVRGSIKVICKEDFVDSIYPQVAIPSECPDCELTQEMLDILAQRLMEDGQTSPDSSGFISLGEQGPIWSLRIGAYQSKRILQQNAELREDYRFAAPSELIKRLGAMRVVGNFRHIIELFPRRYTCDDQGVLTRVMPFADADAANITRGNFQDVSDDWRNAPYEGADILAPKLFKSLVTPPRNSAGGISFPASDYMGTLKFITGAFKMGDASCAADPLEEIGRHYGQLKHAPKPNPAVWLRGGYHIIFKRCVGNTVECTSCSSE